MTVRTSSLINIYSFCTDLYAHAYTVDPDVPVTKQSKVTEVARAKITELAKLARKVLEDTSRPDLRAELTFDIITLSTISEIAALKKRMGFHHAFSNAEENSIICTAIDSLSLLAIKQKNQTDYEDRIKLVSLILTKDSGGLHHFLALVKTSRFVQALVSCSDSATGDKFKQQMMILAQFYVLMPIDDQRQITRALNKALLTKWGYRGFVEIIALKQKLWMADHPLSIDKLIDRHLSNIGKESNPSKLLSETKRMIALISAYNRAARSSTTMPVSPFAFFEFHLANETLSQDNIKGLVSLLECMEKSHPGFIALLCEKNPFHWRGKIFISLEKSGVPEAQKKFILNALCINNPELRDFFTSFPIKEGFKHLKLSQTLSQPRIDRVLGEGICYGVCIQTILKKAPITSNTESEARWCQAIFNLNTEFYLQGRPSKYTFVEEKSRLLESIGLKESSFAVEKIDATFAKKFEEQLKANPEVTDYIFNLHSSEKFTAGHALYVGTSPFIIIDPNDIDPETLFPIVRSFTTLEALSSYLALHVFLDYASLSTLYNRWQLSAYSHLPVFKPIDRAPVTPRPPQVLRPSDRKDRILSDETASHLATPSGDLVPRFEEAETSKRFSFLRETEADKAKNKCEEFFLSKIASLRSEHFGTIYALAESLCSWISTDPSIRFSIVFSHWHEMPQPLQKRLFQSLIARSSELTVVKAFLQIAGEKRSEGMLRQAFRHLTQAQIFTIIELWNDKKLSNEKFKLFASVMHTEIEELSHSLKVKK